MTLQDTPRANRVHIGIFGRRNSGKSSLINALTGQQVALVSSVAGTTTDPVYKTMEMAPIGPVVFIDTAGFDDEGTLGEMRVHATRKIISKVDVAILLFQGEPQEDEKTVAIDRELKWMEELQKAEIPVIPVVGKKDLAENLPERLEYQSRLIEMLSGKSGIKVCYASSITGEGIEDLRKKIAAAVDYTKERNIVMNQLAKPGDTVLLVMPQDIQAPKGRLILPQVQTIRELLDGKCTVVAATADGLGKALEALANPPALIITDSQCFDLVYWQKPAESLLTSFSVLFAAYKGDIAAFVKGAEAIEALKESSKVLIAEACSHAPLEEDIGRVKIPALLRKRVGERLQVEVCAGNDFPEDLTKYDLIIHCGACMFNRKHVLSRIHQAKEAHVPITNYGITMGALQGILDKVAIPMDEGFDLDRENGL